MKPYLSVIIPVHNEARDLDWSLHRLYTQYLDTCMHSYEVILVDNGSTDGTAAILTDEMYRHFRNLRLIELETAGKGLAVRTGMLAANGDWRVMCDRDFSMDPSVIRDLLPIPGDDLFDICITTRQGPGAKRLNEPITRHVSGRVFNAIIRAVTGLPFQDTQCGFKSFSAKAAEDIFSRCQVDGWAFDVEVLYVAMLRMYTIKQVAITWQAYEHSKVRLIRDSVQMIRDVVEIKRRLDQASVQPLERFA